MKGWYRLVTHHKMEPALAYYMSHNIQEAQNIGTIPPELKDKYLWVSYGNNNWNGCHEIFNESPGYCPANKTEFGVVDIKAFACGEYLENKKQRYNEYYSSPIWNRYGDERFNRKQLKNFLFSLYAKPFKVGFGSVYLITEDEIPKVIKDFTQFVESRYEKA